MLSSFSNGVPGYTGHPFFVGLCVLWIFSAATSAMIAPRAGSSAFYVWLYRFTHLLAANLDKCGLLPEQVAEQHFDCEPLPIVSSQQTNQ